jgi:hypothetical protein
MEKQTPLKRDWQDVASSMSRKIVDRTKQVYHEVASRPLLREYLVVGALLVVAVVVRLSLAARGWPHTGSDEATTGLMADDILWHQARPIFFGGSHYLGALQAYLATPFFALLGSSNFVLHIVTTMEIAIFLLAFYAFTRIVFSPMVALGSLFLFALGPSESLLFELRAGGHAQDLFLFGSLTMLLVVLRLGRPWNARWQIALAFAIGAAVGLGFWGSFLVLPFAAVALLALGVEAIRRGNGTPLLARLRQINRQIGALALGIVIALIPFTIGTIASGGVALQEVLSAAGSSGAAAHSGIVQQALGTLVVGLPTTLGRDSVCANCGYWPVPGYPATPTIALRDILVAIPFDLIAIGFWVLAAIPLGRDIWQVVRYWRQHGTLVGAAPAPAFDARWWGRCMLVAGGALTFGAFVASKSSYISPQFSNRYIMGLYLCMPLAVEPLWHGIRNLWNWITGHTQLSLRAGVLAALSLALLTAMQFANILGLVSAFQQTQDRTFFGVPVGSRDAQLIAFLEQHKSTYFYTTYWVCDQVMFEAAEHVTCAVVDNFNAFNAGFNRMSDEAARVKQAQHPAYVFDTTTNEAAPSMLQQMATDLKDGKPQLRGYHTANVDGYIVYYMGG